MFDVKKKYRVIPSQVIFFTVLFLFWLVGGVVSILIRQSDYSYSYTGFFVDYGNYLNVLVYYIMFVVVFFGTLFLSKVNRVPVLTNSSQMIRIALFLFAISVFVKVFQTKSLLFSGDYYARFDTDLDLLSNIMPSVFGIISVSLLKRRSVLDRESGNFNCVVLIVIVSVISSLGGSRSTIFYVFIALSFHSFRISIGHSYLKPILYLVVSLIIYYFLGQVYNVVRWYGLDISWDDAIFAVLGDSFPEFRSHSLAYDIVSAGGDENFVPYGLKGWLINLFAYIFPGPVFDLVGLDRGLEFNGLWKNYFEQIFWANGNAAFGIRTGLIGEISLSLGCYAVAVFASLYAFLLRIIRSKTIVTTVLVGTIPYGATAIYLLVYCCLFEIFIRRLANYRVRL